jgi:hypothetical protein
VGKLKSGQKPVKKGTRRRAISNYLRWRVRHPFAPYRDFYIQDVKGRAARGKVPIWIVQASVGDPEMLEALVGFGLQKSDAVIDYGCGSLRFGASLIEFLDSDRYCGMDIDESFYQAGVDRLPAALKDAKRPVCRTISNAALAEARKLNPRFIASWQVIPVIPPSQQDIYFRSMIGLMGAETMLVADLFETAETERLSEMAWGKSRASIAATIAKIDPTMKVNFHDSPVHMSDEHRHSIVTARR